jgi:hypothetical protein
MRVFKLVFGESARIFGKWKVFGKSENIWRYKLASVFDKSALYAGLHGSFVI